MASQGADISAPPVALSKDSPGTVYSLRVREGDAGPDSYEILLGSANIHVGRMVPNLDGMISVDSVDDEEQPFVLEDVGCVTVPSGFCWGVDWTPDGQYVVCGNQDNGVRVFGRRSSRTDGAAPDTPKSAADGFSKSLRAPYAAARFFGPNGDGAHTSPVRCSSFVAGGALVASGAWDHSVNVWSLEGLAAGVGASEQHYGPPMCRAKLHDDTLNFIAADPFHDNLLATCADDGQVLVHDVEGDFGSPHKIRFGQRGSARLRCVRYSPVSDLLAVASSSGCVLLADPRSRETELTLDTCADGSALFGVDFHPSGDVVVAGGVGGVSCVWDLRRLQASGDKKSAEDCILHRWSYSSDVRAVAVSHDGRFAFAGGNFNQVEARELANAGSGTFTKAARPRGGGAAAPQIG